MHEHELWFTAFLNKYLAGPANALFNAVGFHTEDPTKPWANYIAMELLVILALVIVAALVRASLSVDRPGKLQLVFENIYAFVDEQARDIVGHGHKKYLPYFAMLFVFILSCNLLGIVPTFESPTMYYYMVAGVAATSFLYYNGQGIREQGMLGHLKHFCGPVMFARSAMFLLEVISHCIRPMSLTIRLFANMLAGSR